MTSKMEKDLLDALDERWDDYRRQFRAGRREITEESIHDLRVAARKFLAFLYLLRIIHAHANVKKMRTFLKEQVDELDQLHDAQVMLASATQKMAALRQLAPFQGYLQERTDSLARRARKDIRAFKPSDLKDRFQMLRKAAKKHADDPDLLDQLLGAVDESRSSTARAFKRLDSADPGTIHHVRIAFKKFRYMIEAIQPFLPEYPQGLLARMSDYQDAMGKVHDTTVFLDRLHDFERKLPKDGQGPAASFESGPIETHYRKQLSNLARGYFARKDEFEKFWRPTANSPFPWEQNDESIHRPSRNRRTKTGQQQQRTGQPATTDRHRTQEDAEDRTRVEAVGNRDRPDPDQPILAGR